MVLRCFASCFCIHQTQQMTGHNPKQLPSNLSMTAWSCRSWCRGFVLKHMISYTGSRSHPVAVAVVIVAVLSLLDIDVSAWAAWVVLCLCLSCSWCFLLLLLFLVGAVHIFGTPYITTLLFPHAPLFKLGKTTTAFVVGKCVGWTCNDVDSDGPKPCEGRNPGLFRKEFCFPYQHLPSGTRIHSCWKVERWTIQDKLRVSSTQ